MASNQGLLLMILFADANGFIGFSEGNAMGAKDRLTLVEGEVRNGASSEHDSERAMRRFW